MEKPAHNQLQAPQEFGIRPRPPQGSVLAHVGFPPYVKQRIVPFPQAGNFEISIPLATLGLKPQPGQKLKGDIGILRGNGFQTVQRVYWSNKASGIVADVPSEAELTPKLWGRLEFQGGK